MSHNHFFNVNDPHTCCYDAKLSEELISKCKKATFLVKELAQHSNNSHHILIIFITFK